MSLDINISTSELETILLYRTNEQLVSGDFVLIFQWVMLTVVCQVIDVFGTVTNIINIICFVKQGFKDPINVSLLGLAISDMGCLLTLILTNICYTPTFAAADLPFDPAELQSLVRNIITSKRVAVLVVCIFIVLLGTMAPVYMFNTPGMKFFPRRNKTLLGIIYPTNREHWEMIFYTVNNVFVPFCAFMIIILCTVLLVFKLRENMKWRLSCSAKQADNAAHKNQKVGKMVVIISSLFIACFVPVVILFIAMSLEPGLSRDGKYRNMLIVVGGLTLVFQSVNSASNIFIYYHMSSKYKLVFRQLFCLNTVY